jgi:hypothetical protein
MKQSNLLSLAFWASASLAATSAINSSANAAIVGVDNLAPGSLVITEYLANPIGISDADGEYFEIYNTTTNSIDLAGLRIRDDGSNAFSVTALTILPQSFAVFANSTGEALGLAVSYAYGNAMTLTNSDDEIGLYRPDDTLINKVRYTDGDHFGAGVAHELALAGAGTPLVTNGPIPGFDFIAAATTLPLGNFGSPGTPGSTLVEGAMVPLPASVWMFGSALSILGWTRRQARNAYDGKRRGDNATADIKRRNMS